MTVLDLRYRWNDDWSECEHTCRASLAITPRAICVFNEGESREKAMKITAPPKAVPPTTIIRNARSLVKIGKHGSATALAGHEHDMAFEKQDYA